MVAIQRLQSVLKTYLMDMQQYVDILASLTVQRGRMATVEVPDAAGKLRQITGKWSSYVVYVSHCMQVSRSHVDSRR